MAASASSTSVVTFGRPSAMTIVVTNHCARLLWRGRPSGLRFFRQHMRWWIEFESFRLADAVVVEPVSIVGFPANREKNRDFRNSLLFLGPDAARVPMIWGHQSRIPYSLEQGIFQKDQGNSGSYQGNSVELVERRAFSICHASFCPPNVGSQSIPRGPLCANRC